jgi:hypothetical protein
MLYSRIYESGIDAVLEIIDYMCYQKVLRSEIMHYSLTLSMTAHVGDRENA